MKKLLAFITALLVLSAVLFAEVTIKDLGDGNVEVTFFYGNPRATEVWVAGSFTDWAAGAVPMTKVATGWEYKAVFPVASELKYKFLVNDLNGWTRDFKAPAEVDDGFGGFNGLVEVAKLVEIEKAKASGDTSALEALMAGGLKFGTFTQINLMSTFLTANVARSYKKGLETDSVQMYASSYWKFNGEILPNMPLSMEIEAFKATKDIYRASPNADNGGAVLEADDGIEALATGLLFNPFRYMSPDDRNAPGLGAFKAGLNTSYVNLETAYHWAKPAKRSTIIWETVTDKDSVAGYLQISNGAAVQTFGDIKVDAAIVPNRTLGAMGFRNWVAATYDDSYTVELQWDSMSLAADQTKVSEYFDEFTGNLIAGVKAAVSGADVRFQITTPVASDTVEDAMAYQLNVAYNTEMFGVQTKYGMFEPNATMFYGKGDDVQKNAGKSVIEVNPWVKPIEGVKVGLDNKLTSTYEFETALIDGGMLAYDMKPYVSLVLAALAGQNVTVDAYAKLALDLTEYPSGFEPDDTFYFNELGVKAVMSEVSDMIPSVEVNYALQNSYKFKAFHTVMATVSTKPGVSVDAGFGLRVVDADQPDAVADANQAIAFYLGADYKVVALKNGMLYGAFVYNIDPYEDNKDELKMSDYRPDFGIDNYAGYAKFRLGMKWDF